MNIVISGINGHMGNVLAQLVKSRPEEFTLTGGIDAAGPKEAFGVQVKSLAEADFSDAVLIDFSHHSCTAELLAYAKKYSLPLVLATTGQTDEELAMIDSASKEIPLFFAANYSMGVTLLIELAKKAASVMKDAEIEIVETHHDRKLDSPSGTALAIANGIKQVRPESEFNMGRSGQAKRTKNEIGISSVRMGNIVGIHEVLVGTQNETITLKHEAYSRAVFADGALAAALFLSGKPAGLYNMNSMIEV